MMSRVTVSGIAIVRKAFGSRALEVVGLGLDKPAAWRDAAEFLDRGATDARECIARHPECKAVEAQITCTFTRPEGL